MAMGKQFIRAVPLVQVYMPASAQLIRQYIETIISILILTLTNTTCKDESANYKIVFPLCIVI